MVLLHSFLVRITNVIVIASLLLSPLKVDFYITPNTALAADPVTLEDLHITEDVVWTSDTDLSEYDKIFIENSSTVTIEKGAEISVRHINVLNGRIMAEGTIEEMITIRGIQRADDEFDPYCGVVDILPTIQFDAFADFDDDPISTFSFVRFENMGVDHSFDDEDDCPAMTMQNRIFDMIFPSAYAAPVHRSAPAVLYRSGAVRMKNCIFENNATADVKVHSTFNEYFNSHGYIHIENSNFSNNSQNIAVQSNFVEIPGMPSGDVMSCFGSCMSDYWGDMDQEMNNYMRCYNTCSETEDGAHDNSRVVLKNNWYGDESGPSFDELDKPGDGEKIKGDVTLQENDWRPTSDFASNVLFLPGIKASTLYDADEKRWPPGGGEDVEKLEMTEDGESIYDIYAKNSIKEAFYGGPNIYKSFLGDIQDLKDSNIIADYTDFAYDWRYSVDTITKEGTIISVENYVQNPVAEILQLANSSVSGKVTIVAHSNGGLLTKAIMQELENIGRSELVDNIIMVSSPQMGTPETILALLNGLDQGLPISTLMSDAEARSVMRNMPGVYGLLPSKEYFKRSEEPLIFFTSHDVYKGVYGDDIDDYDEFINFLLGTEDGRERPDEGDTDHEEILNEELIGVADDLHDDIDEWIPPENVNLIQIGGWGLDTAKGVEYIEVEEIKCEEVVVREIGEDDIVLNECSTTSKFVKAPVPTVDGDGTVVTPSSLMLERAENVMRYWVDLYSFSKGFRNNRDHANILEIDSICDLIVHIVKRHKMMDEIPNYIYDSRPSEEHIKNPSPRIRMALYSPLDIHLYDADGNHTGLTVIDIDGENTEIVEEGIPNSYYDVLGEQKYVGWDVESDVRVVLEGYDTGSYTIKLSQVDITGGGEEVAETVEFNALPTSENTLVEFSVPNEGLGQMTDLTADYDGNGESDYIVEPNGSLWDDDGVTIIFSDEDESSDDEDEDEDGNDNQDDNEMDAVGRGVVRNFFTGFLGNEDVKNNDTSTESEIFESVSKEGDDYHFTNKKSDSTMGIWKYIVGFILAAFLIISIIGFVKKKN